MITNGLCSLVALAIDSDDVEVGSILILRDGKIYGGDFLVFSPEPTTVSVASGRVK